MDPKLSGLDPKLREAYERVMSGPTTPPPAGDGHSPLPPAPTPAAAPSPHLDVSSVHSAQPNLAPPPSQPAGMSNPLPNPYSPPAPNPVIQPPPPIMPSMNPNPVPPPPPLGANPMPNPAMPTGATPVSESAGINSTIAFNAHNSSVNKGTTDGKKSGGMGKILVFGLVVLGFFVIYTFVWVYLFHLKLPFIG